MKAEVYYLNWDNDDIPEEERKEADDLLADIRFGDHGIQDLTHYRKVGEMFKPAKTDVYHEAQRLDHKNNEWLNEREERSMSVGDIIIWGEKAFLVKPFGYEELDLDEVTDDG